MAATHRAPKQWALTRRETINSFENWRQNIIYTLSLDCEFEPFTREGAQWQKKTKSNPLRGLTDDDNGLSAATKCTRLELMLGQIANYCPVISRNTIVRNSTSLGQIWQSIRLHYGFQSTGANFIDFSEIALDPDESHEDLFQRLIAFVEDHLLVQDCGITHHGEHPTEDEELTPTLENLIVLTWLRLFDPGLPKLVKQRYGTELRSRTLASIRPEISQAIPSLLDELRSNDARALRTFTQDRSNPSRRRIHNNNVKRSKTCPLCTAMHRKADHWLSECKALPAEDRKFMMRARQIAEITENEPVPENPTDLCEEEYEHETQARRVEISQSPTMPVFSGYTPIRVVLDTGATGNMIREDLATHLGINITPSNQSASQADGKTKLEVIGETRTIFHRQDKDLTFEGLVVRNLDVEVLAGTPFMEVNDIMVRPARKEITFADGSTYKYHSSKAPTIDVRRAHVLRAPDHNITVYPGDFIEASVPEDMADKQVALEPRVDTSHPTWPKPTVMSAVGSYIRVPNLTSAPLNIRRCEHFGQLCHIQDQANIKPLETSEIHSNRTTSTEGTNTTSIVLDPDNILPENSRRELETILIEFDDVFSKNFKGYNGASGPFKAVVNMGPTQPPQRKGRVPMYSRDKLVALQDKMDELEALGVFIKPEDHNITVEYVNPSFLVKKASGGHRLVTAFADVGRYSKPQPTLMPDVDSTLRQIAQWQYICVSDLSSAFYQIPLDKQSMKYCGVVTPFRGVRAYARCAMGMPGSEGALEELMCRVLGDLLREGIVTKLADDLYCGANTPEELCQNWRRVLEALSLNGLCLSPSKTKIAPTKCTILGWIWHSGPISANPHTISTLSTCQRPKTVKEMRSYIGAYKVLARVIPTCAKLMSPLDTAIAGKQSADVIAWSEDLTEAFQVSQKS